MGTENPIINKPGNAVNEPINRHGDKRPPETMWNTSKRFSVYEKISIPIQRNVIIKNSSWGLAFNV